MGGVAVADLVGGPPKTNGPHLTVKSVKKVTVKKGGKAEAVVEAVVVKNFHVQANPPSQPNLIPTTLTLDAADGLKPGAPTYPKGQAYKLRGTAGEIMAYGGTFKITVPVEAEATATTGSHALNGKLRYQACDETTCFPPVKADVSIPVVVN